ncbi:MAG TPA: hypothetical protein VMJ30_11160, partial [Gemmatimonadales bacterium]|nr:hypothetical protein [Gemmatimonadales bacterium]
MQHGHRSVASRASSGVCLSVALLVAWCGRGYANTQPDQLLTGRKLLIKIDTGDPSRNKLVFVSKDTSFDLPDASNNPTAPTGGGRLRVLDLAGSAGMFTITLDHTRWEATKNGFKYKGQTGDACKRVLIKDDHLVKIVCKGSAVALTLPFSGAAALELTIGTSSIRYCASFGGSVKKNTGGAKGIFKSKDALAPGACPCGNGLPNLGEQCDDGNNFNGDCCSSTCQFEAPGSPCEDGNPCTQSETCNGTGVCNGGAPVCGNGVTDLACGEQCDVPDDSACPGLCLANCHCLAPPECAADTSRTVFA